MARCLQEAVKVNSRGRYRVVVVLVVAGAGGGTEQFRGHSEVLETENRTVFDH